MSRTFRKNKDYGRNGGTCRCSMCGKNQGGKSFAARGLYIRNGLGRCEDDRGWNGDKTYERRTLRTRLKNQLRKEVE